MKVRIDYVSNSSSCSFMLVGHAFDDDAVVDAWKKLHPEDEKEHSMYGIVDRIVDELGLNYECGIDKYYGQWVLGLRFDDMEDNETKQQFIDRIKASLKKAFGDVEVHTCVDGGYNG